MALRLTPLTLKEANQFVVAHHRHHGRVVGHRFSLAARLSSTDGPIVGAVVVGRPVSREINQYRVAEVTRLTTDGTKNVCSFLYSAAARVAREMGFERIQTYVLESEPGTSLKAAGRQFDGMTDGGDWNYSWRKGRRTDQPMCRKQRWSKTFD